MAASSSGTGHSRRSSDKPDAAFGEIDDDCGLVQGRSGDTDTSGRYTTMSVSLEGTDRDGDRSQASRNVRLYFDGVCEEDDDD